MAGQAVSGDLSVVAPFSAGVLVAVIDGLGHGEQAEAAAKIAAATLSAHAQEFVVPLLQRCHARLQGTRGVAMSVASFSEQTSSMTWVGVGNVEGVLLRADPTATPPIEFVPLRGGVVGYKLSPVRPASLPVSTGDMLIFATDGIRSSFTHELLKNTPLPLLMQETPQTLADRIFAQYGKSTDDALVLVARYCGGTP